jgi:hypothetical protein
MTAQAPGDRGPRARSGLVKSPIDLAGGLFLLALAVIGYIGGATLPFGTLSGIGSGLLPRVVTLLVGVFGLLLIVQSAFAAGDGLDRWAIRGIIFVLGSVLVFALMVRSYGLVVAGPLAVIISSLADKDTRPLEVVVFAVVMTLICGLLFKELLNLPIPFDPVGIIPDAVTGAYTGLKAQLGAFFTSLKNLFAR